MSQFLDMKAEVLSSQQNQKSGESWLEPEAVIDVLWLDDQDTPHQTRGTFKGLRFPTDGGPVQVILNDEDGESGFYTEDVVGITPVNDQSS